MVGDWEGSQRAGKNMIGSETMQQAIDKMELLVREHKTRQFEPTPNLLELYRILLRRNKGVYLKVQFKAVVGLEIIEAVGNFEHTLGLSKEYFLGKRIDEIDRQNDFTDPDQLLALLEDDVIYKDIQINGREVLVIIWKESPLVYGEFLMLK